MLNLRQKILTCDSHVNPRAMEEFNNAVVLTNRLLKPNELFEVHIDKQVEKWAGSLEIGVTMHSPEDLELPSTMTNVTTGTWMMSGGGIVNNGVTTIEDYGHSLEDLKVFKDIFVMATDVIIKEGV